MRDRTSPYSWGHFELCTCFFHPLNFTMDACGCVDLHYCRIAYTPSRIRADSKGAGARQSANLLLKKETLKSHGIFHTNHQVTKLMRPGIKPGH